MNNRIHQRIMFAVILCLVTVLWALPALGASYSKVYGQTKDRIRVRESASTSAATIDNIVKDRCVYALQSKESGGLTFIEVKYRSHEGDIISGWVCQSDGKTTYVKMLSATQAKTQFGVENGSIPSKVAGTKTAKERAAAKASSGTGISGSTSVETMKQVQTKLKAMGIYSGEITGNAGSKTVAAIKEFQKRYNLTADGVAGPETIAKLNSISTPTSSSSTAAGLKLGSSGTAVAQLQKDLTALGYYWAEITGNFGAKTETAVKSFQKAYGMTQDGVAGAKTLSAIATAVQKKGGSGSVSITTGTTLQLNSEGTAVSTLQQKLKNLGYYTAEVTGHYGEKTQAAVRAFQARNGLTADGIAGAKTLTAINNASKGTTSSSSGSTSGTTLSVGSTGTAVRNLQMNLTTLGYYYGDITGHFGSMTQAAVMKYQKAKGLSQTGTATPTLQSRLASETGTGSKSSYSVASTSLKQGDSGSSVTALQTALTKLGYYYGDITGNYGALTAKAVKRFQEANGLTIDGIAGSKTIAAINAKAGSSISTSSGTKNSAVNGSSTLVSYARASKKAVLRKEASATSQGKAQLDIGTTMKISKQVTRNGVTWYYVKAYQDGYSYVGYVRSDLVTIISYSDFNASNGGSSGGGGGDYEISGVLEVKAGNVAVRTGPSTKDDIAGRVNSGDIFTYVDYDSGWYKIWYNGDYRYISGEFVTTNVDSSKYGYTDTTSYRYGDTAAMVSTIQEWLTLLKYYNGDVTGHYGSKTVDAVQSFQSDNGLTADGIAGPKTIAALQSKVAGATGGTIDSSGTIYTVDWFSAKSTTGEFAKLGFVRGREAKLTDLRTGITINIHVQSAGNHLDAEPLTANDTAKFCAIYRVSNANYINSSDHYYRRPMMFTYGSYKIVCSMYGVPHGQQDITTNNYPGQFCLHFLNSRTSGTDKVDSGHQAAIQEAIKLLNKSVTKLP